MCLICCLRYNQGTLVRMVEHAAQVGIDQKKTVWFGVGKSFENLGPKAWEKRTQRVIEEKIIPNVSSEWKAKLEAHKELIAKTSGWVATAAEIGVVAGVTYGGIKGIRKIIEKSPKSAKDSLKVAVAPVTAGVITAILKKEVVHDSTIVQRDLILSQQKAEKQSEFKKEHPIRYFLSTRKRKKELQGRLRALREIKEANLKKIIPLKRTHDPFFENLGDVQAQIAKEAAKIHTDAEEQKLQVIHQKSASTTHAIQQRVDHVQETAHAAKMKQRVQVEKDKHKVWAETYPAKRKAQDYAEQAKKRWKDTVDRMNDDAQQRLAASIARGNATREARELLEQTQKVAAEKAQITLWNARLDEGIKDAQLRYESRLEDERTHLIQKGRDQFQNPRYFLQNEALVNRLQSGERKSLSWFGDVLGSARRLLDNKKLRPIVYRLAHDIRHGNPQEQWRAAEQLLLLGYNHVDAQTKIRLKKVDSDPNFIAKAKFFIDPQKLNKAGLEPILL